MKHSVCIIDDSIPPGSSADFINDTLLLEKSTLGYLLENETWGDDNVKTLVSNISKDGEHWEISAFRNPSFFFNHIKNNILTPEIIIFDWDYDGSSAHSEDHLYNLLQSTYSIIYVFTGADNEGEVTDLIDSDRFTEFRHRLDVIKKESEESVESLLTAAEEKYSKNFSYRFGKELKLNAVKAIDEILVDISKLSLEDFIKLFGSKRGNKVSISTTELVSIITEKFKHQLQKQKFTHEIESIEGENTDDTLVKKVWSYRLYHQPADDEHVKKGDIIRKARENDNVLYLVLSSNCHMNQFWNKNLGYISLVPLHKLTPRNIAIKQKFNANKAGKLREFNLTSLTNPTSLEGITILPGIKCDDGTYMDYLLNPKEVTTVQIDLPAIDNIDNFKTSLPLLYKYWSEFDGESKIRISEPFLSPLVQFIMDNITGYGCPDFPSSLQSQIKKSFNDARE